VLLASLIAILLLAGLYFAMDMTMRQTQESRDAVDVDNLSRGAFRRMGLDLAATLAPLPPKSGGNSAASSDPGSQPATSSDPSAMTDPSMMATAAPAATGSTPAPATTATPTTTAADPTAMSADGTTPAGPTAAAAAPQFQAGVIGDSENLTIFLNRLPSPLTDSAAFFQPTGGQTPSGLWRVSYWKGGNGQLCRQERAWVTADDVMDPSNVDKGNEAADTLVGEATDVQFKYLDGQGNETDSWDGTAVGDDGVTPLGPPRAVKVTLTYTLQSSRPGGHSFTQKATQVIPVRAAPGAYTPPLVEPSTDPEATSSDPSTGTSGTTGTTSGTATPSSGGATAAPAAGGAAGGGAAGGAGGGR
jgi:hypothetical protein